MDKQKNKKILLIQPTPYDQHGNLVKKNKLYFVGLAMPLLAALTPEEYDVELCYETIEDVPFDTDADIIGISSMGHAVMRTIDIAKKFKELGKTVVLGGYMVSLMPEEAKKYGDVVMIGDAGNIMNRLRIVKSANEIACLKEAGRQACEGYKKLLEYAVDGNPEYMAAGAAEGAARMAGAEDINFMVFGSGIRTETVIGRATDKIMRNGEMLMAAMAVQYQGYVSTVEYPFVIGTPNDEQKKFLNVLFEAANVQQNFLRAGVVSGEMVKAVKAVFAKYNMTKYDLYPPMHGIGLAEAESPYPDENAVYKFESGMCVNSDISIWGHPAGSNRIEEGFVITENGPESITPFIRELVAKGV